MPSFCCYVSYSFLKVYLLYAVILKRKQPNITPGEERTLPLVADINLMSDAAKRLSEKFTST
jgi:hypothetical protein